MAQFIWDSAVRWPPPASVLLNYDVVPPTTARSSPLQPGVLDFVAPDTHGGLRVVLVPDRVAALESDVDSLNESAAALDERVANIEAQVHTAPTIVDQSINYDHTLIVTGAVVATMQASGKPTAWAITYQDLNGLPTTGYWAIDAAGVITATAFGAAAGIRKAAYVEIHMQATNAYGTSSDGRIVVHCT